MSIPAEQVLMRAYSPVGGYYVSERTGVVGTPAADAELFQFRNPDTVKLISVERIQVAMSVAATVSAAQEISGDIFRCTGWTVDGTGGTALSGTPKRSTAAASVVAARIATTAALGVGTKTVDAQRLGSFQGPGQAGGAMSIGINSPVTVFENSGFGAGPLVILGQDQGFIVRNTIAWVSGSARLHVRVDYREL